MNNCVAKTVFVAGLMPFLFACNEKKEESTAVVVDKEQIKQEIQAKENEFADTYNAGVIKPIGYYADDATSFHPNMAPLVGKQAVVDFVTSDFDSTHSKKISFTTKEVFVSNDGNQVVEIGYYKVSDSANNPLSTGNYMTLFEKRDGKYVSVRDMSASDMEANSEKIK
jgi:ketosteroid isomerase-like protein